MTPLINLILDYGKADFLLLLTTVFFILMLYKRDFSFKIVLLAETTLIKRLCMDIIENKEKSKIEESIVEYKNEVVEIYKIKSAQLTKTDYEYIRMSALVCLQNVSNLTSEKLALYLHGKRKEENKKDWYQNWKIRFCVIFFVAILLLFIDVVVNMVVGFDCPFKGMDCFQQIQLLILYIILSMIVSFLWNFIYILFDSYEQYLYADSLSKIQLK